MTSFEFFNDASALNAFCAENNISYLGVFGSHARGTASSNSDIDVLVDFSQPVDYFDLLETEEQLTKELQVPVDLVTAGSVSEKIYPYIQKDLVTVYETT